MRMIVDESRARWVDYAQSPLSPGELEQNADILFPILRYFMTSRCHPSGFAPVGASRTR